MRCSTRLRDASISGTSSCASANSGFSIVRRPTQVLPTRELRHSMHFQTKISLDVRSQLTCSATLAFVNLSGATFVTRPRYDTNTLLFSCQTTIACSYQRCVASAVLVSVLVQFSFARRTRCHHETNLDLAHLHERLPTKHDAHEGSYPQSRRPVFTPTATTSVFQTRENTWGFQKHKNLATFVFTAICNLVRSPTEHAKIQRKRIRPVHHSRQSTHFHQTARPTSLMTFRATPSQMPSLHQTILTRRFCCSEMS